MVSGKTVFLSSNRRHGLSLSIRILSVPPLAILSQMAAHAHLNAVKSVLRVCERFCLARLCGLVQVHCLSLSDRRTCVKVHLPD